MKSTRIFDSEVQKGLRSIYLSSLSQSIATNCDPYVKQFKRTDNSLSFRLAEELAARFLEKHFMAYTAMTLSAETQNAIRIHHERDYMVKKLKYDDKLPVTAYMIDSICSSKERHRRINQRNKKIAEKKGPDSSLLKMLGKSYMYSDKDVESISKVVGHHHSRHHKDPNAVSNRHKGHGKHNHRHRHHSDRKKGEDANEAGENYFSSNDEDALTLIDPGYGLSKNKVSKLDIPARTKNRTCEFVTPMPTGAYIKQTRQDEMDDDGRVNKQKIGNQIGGKDFNRKGKEEEKLPDKNVDEPTKRENESIISEIDVPFEPPIFIPNQYSREAKRLENQFINFSTRCAIEQSPKVKNTINPATFSKDELIEQILLMQQQQSIIKQNQTKLAAKNPGISRIKSNLANINEELLPTVDLSAPANQGELPKQIQHEIPNSTSAARSNSVAKESIIPADKTIHHQDDDDEGDDEEEEEEDDNDNDDKGEDDQDDEDEEEEDDEEEEEEEEDDEEN